MKNIFNTIQYDAPKKNVFDLTHDVKMSMKMGELTPCLVLECIPGDTFVLGADTLVRFAPLISPVMHRMDTTIHYFFVPNRILWDQWEEFITPGAEPKTPPTFYISDNLDANVQRFNDYMGIPKITTGSEFEVSALPFAAYQKIYNDYYRDQNLIPEQPDKLVDGINDITKFSVMRNRSYEHDYFTSALPFAQKGSAVDIPLGNVRLKDDWDDTINKPNFVSDTGTHPPASGSFYQTLGANGQIQTEFQGIPYAYDPDGSLEVTPTTINDLRRAFKLQEWLERAARGGSRMIETLKVFFNVNSSDKRLQRAEYITGTKSPVVISEVLNTNGSFNPETDNPTSPPQGNMAGHAISVNGGKNGSYYCEEHGYIIGIVSTLPKTAYYGGVPRTYLKKDPTDYFWPQFAHLGEQQINALELNANLPSDEPFGYTPRYSEYKYMPSRVAGEFAADSLDFWHMGKIFDSNSSTQLLNKDFIECKPDSDNITRIFAVQDGTDYLYSHILHRIKAIRPMPRFGTPSF